MRKRVLLLTFFICCCIWGCKHLSFDEKCVEEARLQTRKICPRNVANGIVLDSVVYTIPNHTLTYFYTMMAEYDNPEIINQGKAKFHEALKNQIRNSIDLKKYKDKGITFSYIYYSKNTGKVILEETYTVEDYK